MSKEFVPYEIALGLKQLGFDQLGSGYFIGVYNSTEIPVCKAPTFSQAFRWFREKKVLGLVNPIDDWNSWSFSILADDCMSPFFEMSHGDEYKSYEEAELACLAKMIELHKDKVHG